MSIISGTKIFVDNFKNVNVTNESFFFLTHAHYDHTRGLQYFNGKVFCSKETKAVVKNLKGFERTRTKCIPVDEWIKLKNVGKVKAIPVTHCVGSVAFLFHLNDGRNVLHTGDFRALNGFTRILDEKCEGLRFDKVIYDNTYGRYRYLKVGEYKKFPSIAESVNLVEKIVKDCGIENPQVQLLYNGKIGAEYLVLLLQKKKKIHYPFLSKFLPQLFCATAEEADVHLNKCGCDFSDDNLVKIFLSAGGFSEKGSVSEKVKDKINTFRVCYSLHSSGDELGDFLLWAKKNANEGCQFQPLLF